MTSRTWIVLCTCLAVSGCGRETIREILIPARVPALCTTACAEPSGAPTTNGELAEAWAARGETISCYKARQECVREMTAPPSPTGNASKEKAPP